MGNKKLLFILGVIFITLTAKCENPVVFTFDGRYENVNSSMTGNILVDVISDSLLDSLLTQKNIKFRLFFTVDIHGNIKSTANRSQGIPDYIVNTFIDKIKKENCELYVYLGPYSHPKNRTDFLTSMNKKIRNEQLTQFQVQYYFPSDIMVRWKYSKTKERSCNQLPNKEEIRALYRELIAEPFITSKSLGINKTDILYLK